MEVNQTPVKTCYHHDAFHKTCHRCLCETIIHLCDGLDDDVSEIDTKTVARSQGLQEVFNGTSVIQFTNGHIANIVALPVTDEDLANQVIRYTLEYRKKA